MTSLRVSPAMLVDRVAGVALGAPDLGIRSIERLGHRALVEGAIAVGTPIGVVVPVRPTGASLIRGMPSPGR
ncbi:MAG TPA: hypothetical protein VES60_00825 [Nakamurella sp.]|nr:hypothetical protein [Nakamurella sp.]